MKCFGQGKTNECKHGKVLIGYNWMGDMYLMQDSKLGKLQPIMSLHYGYA